MAEARCLNPDCNKEPWVLRKPLSEYSGNGPNCPECGTTRVEIIEGSMRTRLGEGGTAIQTRSHGSGELALAEGEHVVGNIVRVLDGDLPASERTRGARGLLGFLIDGVDLYNDYRAKKMNAQDERARNIELRPADEYPACIECGRQLDGDDIGLNDQYVRCPGCGALYEVIDKESPIEA